VANSHRRWITAFLRVWATLVKAQSSPSVHQGRWGSRAAPTEVSAPLQPQPTWIFVLGTTPQKTGLPPNWPNSKEVPKPWTEHDREAGFGALGYLPDEMRRDDLKNFYRGEKVDLLFQTRHPVVETGILSSTTAPSMMDAIYLRCWLTKFLTVYSVAQPRKIL